MFLRTKRLMLISGANMNSAIAVEQNGSRLTTVALELNEYLIKMSYKLNETHMRPMSVLEQNVLFHHVCVYLCVCARTNTSRFLTKFSLFVCISPSP